ncbi:hypothetical protein QBC38DRAFT_14190 [Podospora fimiseda]|uniref:Uncharacterized protein n=1 Tax=Podospora fimiseda TaxID=252190 RepID=A0AAN7BJH8_9PEZI|nr:hypothetical protein QBC38DRAFT_14190 [Podospora fimiseda]
MICMTWQDFLAIFPVEPLHVCMCMYLVVSDLVCWPLRRARYLRARYRHSMVGPFGPQAGNFHHSASCLLCCSAHSSEITNLHCPVPRRVVFFLRLFFSILSFESEFLFTSYPYFFCFTLSLLFLA